MALDFNNRNPQDPSGIYALDTTSARDAWVNDDWSQVVYSQSEASKAGLKTKVRVATATTNDGKQYDVVLGGDGKPISQLGDTISQDDDVARRWQQNAPARSPGRTPEQQTTDAATARNAAELQRQREANAKLPASQDPAYETDEERRARSERRITQQGADAKTADAKTEATRKEADTTVADVAYTGTGKNRQKVTTYKSGRKVTEAAPTNATPISTTYDTDGTKITKYDDGTETREASKPADGGLAIPPTAPKYTPNYDLDDLGYTAYHEQLVQWVNSGAPGATRQVARQLSEAAGHVAELAASHGTTRRSQAATARGQDITQRGQDINEVESRRTAANTGYDSMMRDIGGNARYLGAGNGGLAATALRDALTLRQAYAEQAGGYANTPQVGPISPAVQAVRGGPGADSTQVAAHPDGRIEVSPPGAAPIGVPPPAQTAGAGTAAPWMPSTGDPTNPTNEVNPNAVGMAPPAYLQSARDAQPSWSPDGAVAQLRQQGYTPDEIAEALQMAGVA